MIRIFYATIGNVGQFLAIRRTHRRPGFSGQGILVAAVNESTSLDFEVRCK
jgi:hypothetical protein